MHEASATISKDGKTLVFARSNDGSRKGPREVGLFISKYLDGKWSDPQPMPFSDPETWYGCPSFAPDGKSLYFASNKRGGKGGLDLYRSTLDANGQWGKVTNLGESINTAGDEMFPYAAEDGKLYFSSDGHAGLGGLDIFVANKDKDGNTTVKNMGVPMNSRWDDFGLSLKTPTEGYFSSNRDGGKGDDDIYYFRDTKNDPRIVKFNLEGVAFGLDDRGKEQILANAHVVLLDAQNKQISESYTDANGMFAFSLEPSKNYTLVADMKDYFTKRDAISTVGKSPDPETLFDKETTVNMAHKMVLEKLKLEKTFVLDNIYYDLNKADIRPDAAIELDKVVEILNDNPTITIELSSHTDSRGDDKLNLKLSQARAESARAYIVSKGIAPERITAKGYGKTKPLIADAATEEDFQKNRRTEFKVIKIKK
jgi:outer membrane protein OmpA-like peptidoglycan-associated protein